MKSRRDGGSCPLEAVHLSKLKQKQKRCRGFLNDDACGSKTDANRQKMSNFHSKLLHLSKLSKLKQKRFRRFLITDACGSKTDASRQKVLNFCSKAEENVDGCWNG